MPDARPSTEDAVAIATSLAKLLHGRQIASAESMTAGRIASAIASVENAADFFRGSIIAYHEMSKRRILGVSAPNVLSLVAAKEMAAGASRVLDARVTVATTGLAGGEPQDGVPVGTVFVATCIDDELDSRRHHFDGQPEEVCEQATLQALRDLLERLTAAGSRIRDVGSHDSSWTTGESLPTSADQFHSSG